MTKRALVSCAAFAIVGASACSGGSNPVVPPPPGSTPTLDGGASERGPSGPPPVEAGGPTAPKDAADVPLRSDSPLGGIDTGPPSIVTITILSLTARGGLDGGAPIDGGSPVDGGGRVGLLSGSDRLAPSVRVTVQSQGGDPTADAIIEVKAILQGEKPSLTASAVLNQTQYQVLPESGTKVSYYGDTPLDTSKLAGGFYDLEVTVRTAGGVTARDTVQVYLDVGPVITFLQPANGVFVRGSVVVTAMITDSRTSVASVVFSVGQSEIDPALVSSNGSLYTVTLDFGSFNPPLDGVQVITVTATNANGVVSLATRKFTADNDGPVITGTKPAMGELIGRLVTLEASVKDPAGVMENSVIAVVAHGDVQHKVTLEKGSDGTFRHVFDTTKLPVYAIFPSISFRAQDVLGNQSSVGYLVSLDNTPPTLDLDPPANFQLIRRSDGACSWPFDPVGPDAIDDGSVVTQLFDIRARIEDNGNTPLTGSADFVPIAAVDPGDVQVFILDDTSLPLVVDTSDPPDGICDDVNPELVPSVAPQSAKDAQVVNMVPMPANAGSGDFSYQPGVACSGGDKPPGAFCGTTYSIEKGRVMTYSLGYATSLPAIWTLPPIVGDGLQCAGRQFDASNNLHDGWACVAVVASDKLGNKQVSRPIRICVAAQLGSTACTAAASGGADLAAVWLPSSPLGAVQVMTTAAVTGPGGAPVAAGDTLIFGDVRPREVAAIVGSHKVEPTGTTGTIFSLTDLSIAPYELWVDNLDGSPPVAKGPVALAFQNGLDVQVGTDTPLTALDPSFAGAVILVAKGAQAGAGDRRWFPVNIEATGFALRDSAPMVKGFVTAAARLPDCTGTLVMGAQGGPSSVDGTKRCKPWSSFPENEVLYIN